MSKLTERESLRKALDTLNLDPVGIVEDYANKPIHEFDQSEKKDMLQTAYEINTYKSKIMKSFGDTHWRTTWDEFIKLLDDMGFREGLSYKFRPDPDEPREETAIIYYHLEKGLVLWATSSTGKDFVYINIGEVRGYFTYHEPVKRTTVPSSYEWGHEREELVKTREFQDAVETIWKCGMTMDALININEGIYFSIDVREGLVSRLKAIESGFTFMPIWPNGSFNFLSFIDGGEYLTERGEDYKRITLEKIKKCPPEMQRIVESFVTKTLEKHPDSLPTNI